MFKVISALILILFAAQAAYASDKEDCQAKSGEVAMKAAALLDIQHALVLEDSDPGKAAALAAGFELLPVVNSTDVPALLAERLGSALLS